MRTVARYSLSVEVAAPRDPIGVLTAIGDRIEAWLSGKGQLVEQRRPQEILRYPDGREGEVRRWAIESTGAALSEVTLSEPIEGAANFETRLMLGLADRDVALLCDLRVGGRDEPLGPVRFDASCPRIVRDVLLAEDLPWCYRSFPLPKGPAGFRGAEGGAALVDLIKSPHRLLPVVAISEDRGLVLHPGIGDAVFRDIAGLGVVALLDGDASWRLTAALGTDWACHSGAIRLYWPGLGPTADPREHPLWTSRRLLADVTDTSAAAARIRAVLRRQIMSASAFAVREPKLFEVIRARDRAARFAAERDKLKKSDDFVALAESYAREAEELRQELAQRREEIDGLRAKVENLQIALRWGGGDADESLSPDTSAAPNTVAQAVAQARVESADALLFGPDVDRGVEGLAPDAGPPEKVLRYLSALAEMSRARAQGTIGTSQLEWLKQRNISASQEGEGVRRAWSGREYDWHLKPSDGVSPDRCVRIYFDWDEAAKRTVVGWVGRHP